MEHTKSQNTPGILVLLDFQKAFDSLEWSFTMNTLDIFNFGTRIKWWISTFYTNIESAVINNGFTTNWFKPSRGVRQGCPLSPYLFVLSVELLSNKIRQDPSIKGIKIFGNEIKVSQFTDDTNLLSADLTSTENVLRTVRKFGVQEILHCLLVMILKSLGLSQLIYSSSILNIPEGFAHLVKTKLVKFLWKNKRDKIKRSRLYQF